MYKIYRYIYYVPSSVHIIMLRLIEALSLSGISPLLFEKMQPYYPYEGKILKIL